MANKTVLTPCSDEFTELSDCRDIKINLHTYAPIDCPDSDFIHGKLFKHTEQSIKCRKGESSERKEETIESTILKQENVGQNKVILFFHGSTGNISHRRYISDLCKHIGIDLFLIDYRGYGHSTGKPSLDNILRDGEVAYHYLRRTYNPEQIIIWGESLGGAVAAAMAAKYPCDRVVLFSTFSSLSDVLKYSKNIAGWKRTMGWVCSYAINNLSTKDILHKIKAPVMIIHSPSDNIIPYKCCELMQGKGSDVKHVKIKGQHATPELSTDNFIDIMNFCYGEPRTYNREEIARQLKIFHSRVHRLNDVIGTG